MNKKDRKQFYAYFDQMMDLAFDEDISDKEYKKQRKYFIDVLEKIFEKYADTSFLGESTFEIIEHYVRTRKFNADQLIRAFAKDINYWDYDVWYLEFDAPEHIIDIFTDVVNTYRDLVGTRPGSR